MTKLNLIHPDFLLNLSEDIEYNINTNKLNNSHRALNLYHLLKQLIYSGYQWQALPDRLKNNIRYIFNGDFLFNFLNEKEVITLMWGMALIAAPTNLFKLNALTVTNFFKPLFQAIAHQHGLSKSIIVSFDEDHAHQLAVAICYFNLPMNEGIIHALDAIISHRVTPTSSQTHLGFANWLGVQGLTPENEARFGNGLIFSDIYLKNLNTIIEVDGAWCHDVRKDQLKDFLLLNRFHVKTIIHLDADKVHQLLYNKFNGDRQLIHYLRQAGLNLYEIYRGPGLFANNACVTSNIGIALPNTCHSDICVADGRITHAP